MQIEFMHWEDTDDVWKRKAADLLFVGFKDIDHAWDTRAEAREEIEAFVMAGVDQTAILAIDGEQLLGWIGAIKNSEHIWELHPLVVHTKFRDKGIGSKLVAALEDKALQEKVSTLYLGSDDVDGSTSLSNFDLYPDPISHLQALKFEKSHPVKFYLKLGYSICGVIPDANGFGKPDILMTKRIS